MTAKTAGRFIRFPWTSRARIRRSDNYL